MNFFNTVSNLMKLMPAHWVVEPEVHHLVTPRNVKFEIKSPENNIEVQDILETVIRQVNPALKLEFLGSLSNEGRSRYTSTFRVSEPRL